MLKIVYGSTKSACGYTFLTSTRLRQLACLATLYHSDIGLSTDGSTATASRHALLLTTRICSDAPSNCLIVLRKLRRNNPISLPTDEAVAFLRLHRKARPVARASHS